ncbi:MAG TPA: RDD family protein, partial [Chitinophagaceae bacterium]|nr:RDD family protein [Chitinophagaceae bacterium]
EFEVPEFYRRLLALLIDMVIQFFYLRIANEIYKSIAMNSSWDIDSNYNMQAVGLLLFLPILLYHPLQEITMNGQSVGKKILGIRVV